MRYFGIRPASFNGLASIGLKIERIKGKSYECKTEFFRPYCVAFLDQLILSANRPVKLSSTYPAVNRYLKQIEFPHLLSSATMHSYFPEENMITVKRFKQDTKKLNDAVPAWLEREVFSKSFAPNFSKELRKQIVENLWEIIFNAIQHSNSINGISCCGQFYPFRGYFEIAFYDHGIGIPQNVRSFQKRLEKFTDHECIDWALKEGTTTKPQMETGGLGLFYLREFLKLNGGWLQIVSKNGLYQSEGKNIFPAEHIKNSFKGTLFNLRIIYDEYTYKFKGEN